MTRRMEGVPATQSTRGSGAGSSPIAWRSGDRRGAWGRT
jgi:hypothetical protein